MRTLAAIFFTIATVTSADVPALVLPVASHDFGTVKQGEKVTHLFPVRNAGTTALRIQGVDLDTPGVKVSYPAELTPGQEARLKIEWNTALVEGEVEGHAIFRTTDAAHPRTSFTFRAVVKPPVQILPLPAAFFSVFAGETSQQTLQIINHEEIPLGIQRLEQEGQHFTARIETITAGKVFRLHVTVPEGAAPGRYMEAVSLITDRPERPRIRVPVNVLIKAELHVDPEIIDFGNVPLTALSRTPGLLHLLSRVVTIKKRQGEFDIRSIESDIAALEIEKTPSGRGNAFRVDVRLARKRLQPGSLTGTIRIHTSDTKFPLIVIRVRGELK